MEKTINKTQEAIRKLSPELKNFIHELFLLSVSQTVHDGSLSSCDENYITPDVLSLLKHHKTIIDGVDCSVLNYTDMQIFDLYRASINNIINDRKDIAAMKDFLRDFGNLIKWAMICWNYKHQDKKQRHLSISGHIVMNIKGLTPLLSKTLLKNVNIISNANNSLCSSQPAIIRDIYRGTLTIAKNDVNALMAFGKYIIAILTNPYSSEYEEFYNWVTSNTNLFGGRPIPKQDLLNFKNFSFSVDPLHEKNYIQNPKGAYQAWQLTIYINNAPEDYKTLIGKMFEFKFNTFAMHHTAKHGEAAQDEYKKEVYKFTKEVFPIETPSGGLEFYADDEDDTGFKEAINCYDRHINANVIPITK